jgi:hypothetical protein
VRCSSYRERTFFTYLVVGVTLTVGGVDGIIVGKANMTKPCVRGRYTEEEEKRLCNIIALTAHLRTYRECVKIFFPFLHVHLVN